MPTLRLRPLGARWPVGSALLLLALAGPAMAAATVSGTVKVPGTTRTNTFKGAILQDMDSGYGYFLGPSQSGSVFFGAP